MDTRWRGQNLKDPSPNRFKPLEVMKPRTFSHPSPVALAPDHLPQEVRPPAERRLPRLLRAREPLPDLQELGADPVHVADGALGEVLGGTRKADHTVAVATGHPVVHVLQEEGERLAVLLALDVLQVVGVYNADLGENDYFGGYCRCFNRLMMCVRKKANASPFFSRLTYSR
jgi:hypothetical protein